MTRKSERWTELDMQILEQRRNPAPNTFSNDTPDPGPESDLLRKCTEWLRKKHIKYIHVIGKKNKAGILDLYCFLPQAHVVVFELKSKTGRMSDEQKEWVAYLGYHRYSVYPGVKSFKRFVKIINDELKHSETISDGIGKGSWTRWCQR